MELSLRRTSFLLLLFFFSNAVLLRSIDAEVITLTSETFSDKVKEKGTVWFVKFCVPWCKFCKNLGNLWEELAKSVEVEDEIEIGQVDCSVDKPVCTKTDIHSYPTFKVFYDGKKFRNTKNLQKVALEAFTARESHPASNFRTAFCSKIHLPSSHHPKIALYASNLQLLDLESDNLQFIICLFHQLLSFNPMHEIVSQTCEGY
ncbi:unnamed protein product [Spirodela intermedia]|uniref:Thioredoxin domain-containing protein n=1 Tax=Spirodela intermedia TaxID=51605 RepID=A0A7I8IXS6_SPIIN|nr:unnamed protein product [Spirodela intermedia]CAA6661810.1 unnamed protein product [Spirodela intermedia]